MKKITHEQFGLISDSVKDSVKEKLNLLEELKSPIVNERKCLDEYIKATGDLSNRYATLDDEQIISALRNCLKLSEKVTLEVIDFYTELGDKREEIDNICDDAHKDANFFRDIYVNSLEKHTDKLIYEKGKGGRSGADYRSYETIIIRFITKYLDAPKREKYTIPRTIEDITKEIESIDGSNRKISDSTFKTWKQNLEKTGYTIYKI